NDTVAFEIAGAPGLAGFDEVGEGDDVVGDGDLAVAVDVAWLEEAGADVVDGRLGGEVQAIVLFRLGAQAVDEAIDGGLAAEGSVVAGDIAIGIGKVDLLGDAGGVYDGVPERPGGGRVERAEAEPGGVGAGAEVA